MRKNTGNRNILLCGMEANSIRVSPRLSQEGHSRQENTKRAAFPPPGIPCASTPRYAEYSQENIDC